MAAKDIAQLLRGMGYAPKGSKADPYADIRTADFTEVDAFRRENTGGEEFVETPYKETQTSLFLNPKYESKYNRISKIDDSTYQVTLQRPGMHKYDTMAAQYKKDEKTGKYILQGNPMVTREVASSQDMGHDAVDALGKFVAASVALYGGAAGGSALGSALGLSGTTATAVGTGLTSAATAATTGARGGDIWKAGITGAAGAGLGQALSNAGMGAAASGAIGQAGATAIRGGDVKDIIRSGVAGGASGGLQQSGMLSGLDPAIQRAITGAVSGGIKGGTKGAISGAVSGGTASNATARVIAQLLMRAIAGQQQQPRKS